MKVAILTPTLNAASHLEACLRSVRAQTYPRALIQHLVLDGGSADPTASLARAAGAEVHVREDGSLYEALNRGIGLARGDVVGWLNADDTYEADAVERAVAALRARPSAELAVGHFRLEAEGRTRLMRSRVDALERLAAGRLRGSWVWPIAIFFRAATLRGLGPYPPGYRIAADKVLWMRAAARRPRPEVVHTGSVIGTFRVHAGSLSTGADPEKSLLETIDIMRRALADGGEPAGVRRWALAALRREMFWWVKWKSRELPLGGRLRALLRYHADIRPWGPGSLLDVREEIGATLGELARAAVGRSTRRW